MASIDRTAYPRFKSSLTANELQTLYRPSDEEQQFVAKYARGAAGLLTLLTLLKCHQNLGYTPALTDVPSQIRTYLALYQRSCHQGQSIFDHRHETQNLTDTLPLSLGRYY